MKVLKDLQEVSGIPSISLSYIFLSCLDIDKRKKRRVDTIISTLASGKLYVPDLDFKSRSNTLPLCTCKLPRNG